MKRTCYLLSLAMVTILGFSAYAGTKSNTAAPDDKTAVKEVKVDEESKAKAVKNKANGKKKKKEKSKFQKEQTIVKAMRKSVAHVEYELQYDNGEKPYAANLNCNVINQERPALASAFVLSPDKVITTDPMIQPRFVKAIYVCRGDQKIKAEIDSYATDQKAMILKLAQPLTKVKPLKFAPRSKDPYTLARYVYSEGKWIVVARAFATSAAVKTAEPKTILRKLPKAFGVLCNKTGKPVCVIAGGDKLVPAKAKWKKPVAKWEMTTNKQLEDELKKLKTNFDANIVRVALSFRSPRKDPTQRMRSYGSSDSESTEKNVLGVVIAPQKLLVVSLIEPKTTARLERIRVYPNGKEMAAKFSKSLKNYGGFIITTEKPMPSTQAISDKDITSFRKALLLSAEPRLEGENLTVYYYHSRISHFITGWRSNLYPELAGYHDNKMFIFDQTGKLVALPIARRKPVGGGSSRWERSSGAKLTAATQIAKVVLADKIPADEIDLANVPLSEEEENRLAWLGVSLQPLNAELARINKVSDKTNDGKFGAIVSYIYPNSPAAKAGIELGDIFLQIHVKDQPKPIKIKMEEYIFSRRPFPWAQLGQIPEQYFDRIPTPWVPAETSFTRSLTDLGFGKEFTLDYVQEGKELAKAFKVTQSPDHYNSAKRYKNKDIGMTIRNMTYEVRRYFQKTPTDPGVIVTKIEPGSKASVGGVRPYEIITHVNDQPVNSADEFEKLVKDAKGELKLAVTRMQKSRVVKLRLNGNGKAATTKPAATQPAAAQKPTPTTLPAEAPAMPAAAKPGVKTPAKPEAKAAPKTEKKTEKPAKPSPKPEKPAETKGI